MDAGQILLPAAGFLSGSIPFSHIIGRSMGHDLRREGSGNVGATNLLRVCGRRAGAAGLALDAVKGAVPVLVARLSGAGGVVMAVTALAAVAGHVFTPWLGFRGGKGVATALGGLAVLAPLPLACALVVFAAVLAVSRTVSLSSVSAALALVPASLLLPAGDAPLAPRAACVLISLIVVARHASNLGRLLKGTEGRLDGR